LTRSTEKSFGEIYSEGTNTMVTFFGPILLDCSAAATLAAWRTISISNTRLYAGRLRIIFRKAATSSLPEEDDEKCKQKEYQKCKEMQKRSEIKRDQIKKDQIKVMSEIIKQKCKKRSNRYQNSKKIKSRKKCKQRKTKKKLQ
jgi:hypothetical protein